MNVSPWVGVVTAAPGESGADVVEATAGETPGEGLGGDDAADATSMTGGAKGGASGNGFVPGADPFCTTE